MYTFYTNAHCMYKCSWGWTLGCYKHVENTIIELKYYYNMLYCVGSYYFTIKQSAAVCVYVTVMLYCCMLWLYNAVYSFVLYRNKLTADARSISMTASLKILPRVFLTVNRTRDLERCSSIPQGRVWIGLVLITGIVKQTSAITSQYSQGVLYQLTGKSKGKSKSKGKN
jgi:hypothetical protein